MSYDDWKTTNPADEELGRTNGEPAPYRCRDCAWRGKGVLAASDHFWATEHTVLFADDPRFDDSRTTKASA